MHEKRSQQRVPNRIQVFFGPEGTPYVGFIRNLSVGGVAINSRTVYKPGTYLNLVIRSEPTDIRTEGQVRWSYRPECPTGFDASFDMGIMFTDYNAEYQQLLEKLQGSFKELRKEPRFEKVFRVRFNGPQEFMDAYTLNISIGGLYIQTEEPLEMKSLIDVEIELADINRTIRVEGKVVFVANQQVAERLGMNAGVGVEITKYFDDGKAVFQDYCNKLIR